MEKTEDISTIADEHFFSGGFVAGTQILMKDGSSKNIEDIKDGEEVMSPDGSERVLKVIQPSLHMRRNLYHIANQNGQKVENFMFVDSQVFLTGRKDVGEGVFAAAEPQQVKNPLMRMKGVGDIEGSVLVSHEHLPFGTVAKSLVKDVPPQQVYHLMLDHQDYFFAGNATQKFMVLAYCPKLLDYQTGLTKKIHSVVASLEQENKNEISKLTLDNLWELERKGLLVNEKLLINRLSEKKGVQAVTATPMHSVNLGWKMRMIQTLLVNIFVPKIQHLVNLCHRQLVPVKVAHNKMWISPSIHDIEWRPGVKHLEVLKLALSITNTLDSTVERTIEEKPTDFVTKVSKCVYLRTQKNLDDPTHNHWVLRLRLSDGKRQMEGSFPFIDDVKDYYSTGKMKLWEGNQHQAFVSFDVRIIDEATKLAEEATLDNKEAACGAPMETKLLDALRGFAKEVLIPQQALALNK
ncbi:Hint domain-containing homing endonuclease [Microscilla marina]|uniref:Hom-end-associated Hint domain-containing protein n=1 Tax=Microscilla marina ATCC 23134 TaxID=313606 RepID=A1ZUM1_MICM2|nr:Hint domain-containing homing endonuclease [Microscilla marina]EAY25907.1 hypothetical protein M23134_00861 [Microscilla marina ATCC 23134]